MRVRIIGVKCSSRMHYELAGLVHNIRELKQVFVNDMSAN